MKQHLRFRGGYCPKRIQPIYLLFIVLLLTGMSEKGACGQSVSQATTPDTTKTIRDTLSIEEVEINTGYQSISRERFVGAVSILDSAAFHRRAGAGILERLDGTVPGVVFDKKSGTSPRLQVRGISTLGGVYNDPGQLQPLIILDNFPFDGELSDINPNDIASVSVLKDAAAASIWGSKAGNGVIVVTTKSGKLNQDGRITVRSNAGFQNKPDLHYYPRMTSREFVEVERFLFAQGYFDADLANSTYPYSWPVVSPAAELLDLRERGLMEAVEADARLERLAKSDYRDQLDRHWYREAFSQQHHVGFSGGGSTYAYNFSGGYNQSGSNVRNAAGQHGFTLAANNTFRPLQGLQIEAGLNYSLTDDRSPGHLLPGRSSPYLALADEHGNALAVPEGYRLGYVDTAGGGGLLDWHFRPLEEIRRADNLDRRQLVRIHAGLSYALTPWLRAGMRYQYTRQQNDSRNHYAADTWLVRDLVNRYTNFTETNADRRNPVPHGGILDLGGGVQGSSHYRAQLQATRDWGETHKLDALLAAERSESAQNTHASRLYGYNDAYGTYKTNVDYLTLFPMYHAFYTRNTVPAGASYREAYLNRTVSFLGNASYTFSKRYTVYGSARRDGSNLFGVATNNKWKPLWSVGGSWEVTREPFTLPTFLGYLRVRASYGYTGNVNNGVSGYPTMIYQNITTGTSSLNNLPRGQLLNPPNPNLRWEQVRTVNAGGDFSAFGNRLSGSIDAFRKRSTDLISTIPFDPTTGVLQYTVNAASLKGNGFEVSLRSVNLEGPVSWTTDLNISHARMVVARVHDGGFRAADFIAYGLHPAEGRVAYGISSYRWAGLDPETGDPQGYLNGETSKRYADIFNDSVENQVFHGSAIPLYAGFITNTLRWKGLTLSANLTYRLAFHFRQPSLHYGALFSGSGLHADYSRRWQHPGDERLTDVPSMRYPIPADVALRDDFYAGAAVHVKRGDNLRLQDIRFAWDLPQRLTGKKGLKNLEFFIYGNNLNLILWKAYDGRLDADFTGNDVTATPVPASWSAGIIVGI